jgi:hypothetical protein
LHCDGQTASDRHHALLLLLLFNLLSRDLVPILVERDAVFGDALVEFLLRPHAILLAEYRAQAQHATEENHPNQQSDGPKDPPW